MTKVYRCPVHGLIESPTWHETVPEEDCGYYCPINLSARDGNKGITDDVCGQDVRGPFEAIVRQSPLAQVDPVLKDPPFPHGLLALMAAPKQVYNHRTAKGRARRS